MARFRGTLHDIVVCRDVEEHFAHSVVRIMDVPARGVLDSLGLTSDWPCAWGRTQAGLRCRPMNHHVPPLCTAAMA